jgi:hypothetical protein
MAINSSIELFSLVLVFMWPVTRGSWSSNPSSLEFDSFPSSFSGLKEYDATSRVYSHPIFKQNLGRKFDKSRPYMNGFKHSLS